MSQARQVPPGIQGGQCCLDTQDWKSLRGPPGLGRGLRGVSDGGGAGAGRRRCRCDPLGSPGSPTSLMTSTARSTEPHPPEPTTEADRLGRKHTRPPPGPALFGRGVGRALGLLCPEESSQLANLPVDAGARGAAQGLVLLHAVSVVPHVAHVAREQGADGLQLLQ